jgi:hypothetical protein
MPKVLARMHTHTHAHTHTHMHKIMLQWHFMHTPHHGWVSEPQILDLADLPLHHSADPEPNLDLGEGLLPSLAETHTHTHTPHMYLCVLRAEKADLGVVGKTRPP